MVIHNSSHSSSTIGLGLAIFFDGILEAGFRRGADGILRLIVGNSDEGNLRFAVGNLEEGIFFLMLGNFFDGIFAMKDSNLCEMVKATPLAILTSRNRVR